MGSAAARAKHLGDARAHRKNRQRETHDAHASELPNSGSRSGKSTMNISQMTPLPLPKWRSRVVLALLAAGFGILLARALYLQGLNHSFLQQKGESRYSRVIELRATRGMIIDRNGEPLA